MKKKTKPSISKLKKKADAAFSAYIRQRDCGVCFTCGVKRPWKDMQAGHFVSRRHLSTRYHEKNVHCQCVQCNVFLKGNMVKYARSLMDKYGDNIIEDLDNLSKIIVPFKRADYESIINAYKHNLV